MIRPIIPADPYAEPKKKPRLSPREEREGLAYKTPMQASERVDDAVPLSPGFDDAEQGRRIAQAGFQGAVLGGVVPSAAARNQAANSATERARYIELNDRFNRGTAQNLRSKQSGGKIAASSEDLDSLRAERDALSAKFNSQANAADATRRTDQSPEARREKMRELDRQLANNYKLQGDTANADRVNARITENQYSPPADTTSERTAAISRTMAGNRGQEADKILALRMEREAMAKKAQGLVQETGMQQLTNARDAAVAEGTTPAASAQKQLETLGATHALSQAEKGIKLQAAGLAGPEDVDRFRNEILESVTAAVDASPGSSGEEAMIVLENEQLPRLVELAKADPDLAKSIARQIRSRLAISKTGFWNSVGQFADKITPDAAQRGPVSQLYTPLFGQGKRTNTKNVNIEKILRSIEYPTAN